jgi:hypothetical protein
MRCNTFEMIERAGKANPVPFSIIEHTKTHQRNAASLPIRKGLRVRAMMMP